MAGRFVALGATALLLLAGCTSDDGALPPPASTPLTPSPSAQPDAAAAALLRPTDLPGEYTEHDIDVAERWGEVTDELSGLTPLRPDCAEELEAIHGTLTATPPESVGAEFVSDDSTVVQIAATTQPETAYSIVSQIAALNSHCDSYVMQAPDWGSLVLTVKPLEIEGLPDGDVATAVWERTLMSEHLRQSATRVAVATNGVVSFVEILGEPEFDDDQVATLVSQVVELAEGAGQ